MFIVSDFYAINAKNLCVTFRTIILSMAKLFVFISDQGADNLLFQSQCKNPLTNLQTHHNVINRFNTAIIISPVTIGQLPL